MDDEPPSRSVGVEMLRAFLNSKNEIDFSKNVRSPLTQFGKLVEEVTGVKSTIPEITPVRSWSDVQYNNKRYWLPLSEVDAKRGVHYIYAPAVMDVIRSPKLGPFYMLSWELLLGTVLTSFSHKSPEGPLGTLFAGALTSVAMVFGSVENEVSAMEYLDNIQTTASTLLEEVIKTRGEWTESVPIDFYLRTAYQLTFDAVSLWTALTVKTVSFGLVNEELVARDIARFILDNPEVNVGAFHTKGIEVARLIDYNRGRDLAEMAYQVTSAILTATSYTRPDDTESWRMFR